MKSDAFYNWQRANSAIMRSFTPKEEEVKLSLVMTANVSDQLASSLKALDKEPGKIKPSQDTLKAAIILSFVATKIINDCVTDYDKVMHIIKDNVDINTLMENMSLEDIDLSEYIKQE